MKVMPENTPRLKAENKYYSDGITGAVEGIWVRKSLVSMIEKVIDLLPSNITLVVWDAWRPISVQKFLSQKVQSTVQNTNNFISPENVCEEAGKYAADPDDIKIGSPPHLTGGAIDVCLLDSNGNMLNMGTPLDYVGPEAATAYYEIVKAKRMLNKQEQIAMKNRRVLYNVMTQVGFTNYLYEWWHFDYGNQFWAIVKKCDAIYNATQIYDGSWLENN